MELLSKGEARPRLCKTYLHNGETKGDQKNDRSKKDIYLLLLLTGREDEAIEARRKWEEQREWEGQENHTVKDASI